MRRRAWLWTAATPLLPTLTVALATALFRTKSAPLQVGSTMAAMLAVLFVLPAALLSARDCWRRSARFSRDLRDGEVELWSAGDAKPAVRRLRHSGWLLDASGATRRRLEGVEAAEVAEVPAAAFWIGVPAHHLPPETPALERRRLADGEATELRAHVSSRMRGLCLLAGCLLLFLVPQLAPLFGGREWRSGPTRWIYLVPIAWLGWRALRLAAFTVKLRRDAGFGYLVAPAGDHRNEYLAASGIPWTVDGGPAPWRL